MGIDGQVDGKFAAPHTDYLEVNNTGRFFTLENKRVIQLRKPE